MGTQKLIIILLCLGIFYPAAAEIVIEGELTHYNTAVPGGSYTGLVVISNIGTETEQVRVYLRDYLFYADGRILYEQPGFHDRTNAVWLSFSPQLVDVEAFQQVEIRYRVNVPDSPELNGTYWSILMVETVPDAAEPAANQENNTLALGLRQVFRYAVQIITDINTREPVQIQFDQTRLVAEEERLFFFFDAVNTGEYWARSNTWVELYGDDGTLLEKITTNEKRIYPGTSVRFGFDLSAYRGSTVTALAIIDCGGADIFGANFVLKLNE